MPYTFETVYNPKACAAMAKALRKTFRRKRSRYTRACGCIALVVGAVLVIPWYRGYEFDLSTVVTLLAMAAILIVLLFEDRINGFLAYKHMLPGTTKNTAVFSEEGFTTQNEAGETRWQYNKVLKAVRLGDYYILLFSKNHGQVYDARSMKGGDGAGFERMLEEKTGGAVERLR